MTNLLQQVIAELEKLPAEDQDVMASRILADLEDDHAWSRRFEATTPTQWSKLAELAQREISAGETFPIEDVFPLRDSED
jgi:hypothetical protein